ncbi:hypothetical protein LCGC14_0952870 [marine sediment metagenome]|uniref:Uncharacterized protein n=1 Tax=marine sediment metagenome TaxID=412755 RepID=A0A0F9R026_9ZZZZ
MSESLLDYGSEMDEDLTLKIFNDGEEVQLLIKTAERHLSDAGKPSIAVTLESIQYPDDYDDIYVYIGIIIDEDTGKARKKKLSRLKEFYAAFGIDHTMPVTIEIDLPGKTGWGIVGVEDYQGNTKNTIKRFGVGS